MTNRKTRRRRRSRKPSNDLDRIELNMTKKAFKLAKKRKPFYRV